MTNPISGNQFFTRVENIAGQLTNLNASVASVGSLTVGGAMSAGSAVLTGTNQSSTVVGYAPASFATGAISSIHNLMTAPGLGAATVVTDPNLLHLPAGAVVDRVVVTNNGTTVVGGTSFTVGTKSSVLAGALTNTTTTNAVVAMLLATVNAATGGAVGGNTDGSSELALGTAGQVTTLGTLAGQAQGAFDNLVAVVVNTQPNTAGDLCVEITYHNA